MLFLKLVLYAAVSMRGAARGGALAYTTGLLPGPPPSWFPIRLWLLRGGYYKLTRPQPVAADWIWIIDHSIQLGTTKCLVILGLRGAHLSGPARCLRHEEGEPLALYPVTQSTGAVVYQQLEETVARAIVGDAGSDLRGGIQQFCHSPPETRYIYDITHKPAAVLKQELPQDPVWRAFTLLAARTKSRIQQTTLAALAPPAQRRTAHYMNMKPLSQWGQQILAVLARPPATYPADHLQAKLGWGRAFTTHLAEWPALFHLSSQVTHFVRQQGLYPEIGPDIQHAVPANGDLPPQISRVRQQLIDFVITTAQQVQPQERLLGSSEVVESVFGKFKYLERTQAHSGFTGLLLSIPAMVSQTTAAVVQQAMETVSTDQVRKWGQQHLGTSVQPQRRQAWIAAKTAQKQDQLRTPP